MHIAQRLLSSNCLKLKTCVLGLGPGSRQSSKGLPEEEFWLCHSPRHSELFWSHLVTLQAYSSQIRTL